MSYHEKPALSLYRNIGKEGIFSETFLKPLKIREPNLIETLDVEKITLKTMLEEAYVLPPPPTRKLDIQTLYDKHRIEVSEEVSINKKNNSLGYIVGGVGTVAASANLLTGGFGIIVATILILLWVVLVFLLSLN